MPAPGPDAQPLSRYNDHGNLARPPSDDLIADLISRHPARPAAEIAALLPAGGR